MKLKINKGILWLKILYTLYGFGIMISMPFYVLQLYSLGLDEEDISLIVGIVPLITMITTPLLGNLNQLIGKTVGSILVFITFLVSFYCIINDLLE